ncbi:hypothetical protein V8B97DRAFT_1920655 [Scleroderma yunnanense]
MEDEAAQAFKLKQHKQHATHICQDLGLPEGSLDPYGTLLAQYQERKKSDAEIFISLDMFKDILKDHLQACLLSLNLTTYSDSLPENTLAFALKNLLTFKISSEVVEDSEMMCTIDSLIKEILTQQRSGMKQKVHISQLSKSLVPTGHYETTTNYWVWFASLNSLLTFNELVDEGVATASTKRRKSTMTDEDESVTQHQER